MDIRRNHRDLSREEKAAFINAVLTLKNNINSVLRPGQQSRYDDFVQIHKNSMGRGNPLVPNPHQSPLFYPWHRILIRQFELALQAAVDDPRITLPYWNWQIGGADNPFTSNFMGGNGDNTQNQLVTTGPFSNNQSSFIVSVWDEGVGSAGLRRNLGADGRLPSEEAVISVLNITPYWLEPGGWENTSERELHNPVHAWIGGNMQEAVSPNDPIFFLHHCYLDLLWERWRHQHPNVPSFPQDDLINSTLVFHPENELAPWSQSFTVQQTLYTTELGYRYEYW
ncbi:tyrosinase family protein [Pseudomonas fitomaticsae]|uniref:Tyrosinase family protein n=1 Tax=Pseudomonas fitomaticsae TaxID=2837969 RepID=A0ABY3PW42_9PSED|nr:tyrosinase family protein [Pseudomonas fitomaticsae]UFP97955.1 tyrosinase family protein [Pseudomonas fitomaticsae]